MKASIVFVLASSIALSSSVWASLNLSGTYSQGDCVTNNDDYIHPSLFVAGDTFTQYGTNKIIIRQEGDSVIYGHFEYKQTDIDGHVTWVAYDDEVTHVGDKGIKWDKTGLSIRERDIDVSIDSSYPLSAATIEGKREHYSLDADGNLIVKGKEYQHGVIGLLYVIPLPINSTLRYTCVFKRIEDLKP